MANNVSNLGQTINSVQRTKSIQSQMADMQQRIGTGERSQDYKGYGSEAIRIQRYRAELGSIDTYVNNIDIAKTNIKQVNLSLDEIIKQVGNVLNGMSIQITEGEKYDINSVKNLADTALQIITANVNVKVGDRYLFAGTDLSNEPYASTPQSKSIAETNVTDWLSGTITKDTFLANIKNITDSQAGFSLGVQSGQKVFARVDDNFEVDYTVLANDPAIKDIILNLTSLSQMKEPASTDAATRKDFFAIMDGFYKNLQGAVEGVRASSARIAASYQAVDTVRTNHVTDKQGLLQTLESVESQDVSEAIVNYQTLSTQLETSYRVTSIMSQLSLARYLV